jgi:hypothetical protein
MAQHTPQSAWTYTAGDVPGQLCNQKGRLFVAIRSMNMPIGLPGEEGSLICEHADARMSLIGFFIVVPPILAWFFTYTVGYDKVLSHRAAERIDATRVELSQWGWLF